MIDHINHTRDGHIVTIEDPIEVLHQDDRCIVNQREIGIDTESYADALRHVVRQDPDVILIGEMRDHETVVGRAHRGRDRQPRASRRCTRSTRPRRSTASSTSSRRTSRSRYA